MARQASGDELSLEKAREVIKRATTVEQLRQAQAVVLPLEHGLDLNQTASIIGVCPGWACQLRTKFLRGHLVGAPDAPKRGGRRNQNLTPEQEREFLSPFLEQAALGGVLVVGPIKQALEQHLGRSVALSSVYNLLHRHGWRKLAPDKRHPKSDPQAQDEWKKNSPKHSPRSAKTGRKTNPSS